MPTVVFTSCRICERFSILYDLSFSASMISSSCPVILLSTVSDDDEKLHVVGVGEDVRADIEHAELVGQLLTGRFGREVRSLEDQLFAALQLRSDQPAFVDDGDLLLVAARILHDEHRGEHQADHQQGHEQRGDDEGFFADALVEFAPYDNADL